MFKAGNITLQSIIVVVVVTLNIFHTLLYSVIVAEVEQFVTVSKKNTAQVRAYTT